MNLNSNLKIEGVLLTMFDARLNLGLEVVEEIRKYFQDKVYNTIIPRLVRLTEAPSHGKPIIAYDPKSRGSEAYLNLAKEVIEKMKEENKRRALGRGLEELFSIEDINYGNLEEK